MSVEIGSVAHCAYMLRKLSIEMAEQARSGHPTSCLSCADIVATLFFNVLLIDIEHFEDPANDRFILSKGHASAILYAVWHMLGKLSYQELMTYRQFTSVLEGHPTPRFKYTEAATGSLGTGLGIGVGQALYAKKEGLDFKVYVLAGDGELFEGSNWEAACLAAHYELDNLVLIIDCNRLGQSGATIFGHDINSYERKLTAFGFETYVVDGHDINELIKLFAVVKKPGKKPYAVLAKTYKGSGVDFVEDKEGFHGKPFVGATYEQSLTALQRFWQTQDHTSTPPAVQPKKPTKQLSKAVEIQPNIPAALPLYAVGQMISARYGFGDGLRALGYQTDQVVVLDADVQNSTFTDLFARAFPDRFVECFIGEQNMVAVAIGMARRGRCTFLATFGAFLSRAHDQIRMAAIGQAPLRICGSHTGVSIGQDGPSQMALEDIAMMRCLPNSVVLCASDAISSFKSVHLMFLYNSGISYVRTTRAELPVLYPADMVFEIGRSYVLKKSTGDVACVLAAGVTVFEALKALSILQSEHGRTITVVDIYSIKPFDRDMVALLVADAHNRLIVIEDHYYEGGVGEMVSSSFAGLGFNITCLAVGKLCRSGMADELLAWAQIDAHAIVNTVLRLIKK